MTTNWTAAVLACSALVAGQALAAQMTKEEIISAATQRGLCGLDRSPVDGYYDESGRALVVCAEVEGFVPLAGALGLGGTGAALAGLVAVALGAGGGGATSTTPSSD